MSKITISSIAKNGKCGNILANFDIETSFEGLEVSEFYQESDYGV